jgi:hypothetical protein
MEVSAISQGYEKFMIGTNTEVFTSDTEPHTSARLAAPGCDTAHRRGLAVAYRRYSLDYVDDEKRQYGATPKESGVGRSLCVGIGGRACGSQWRLRSPAFSFSRVAIDFRRSR